MHELLFLQLKKVLNLPSTRLREIRENPHSLNALLQNISSRQLLQLLHEISSAYEEHDQQNQRLNRALRISTHEADDPATELLRQEERKCRLLLDVMTAADGQEALHMFRTCRQMAVPRDRQIRCLIPDLTMPRMDGL